jgi:hypothetical protein
MTRVIFAQDHIANYDGRPIIVTDESMVAQDLDRGGIWRKRGEILEEVFYEQGHHHLSVNQVSDRVIFTESRILEALCHRFDPQGF